LNWQDFTEQTKPDTQKIEHIITKTISQKVTKFKKISIALSSGIDSTLVLAILRKVCPDITVESISVTFSNSVDESHAAKKISEKFDTNHHILLIDNFFKELPKAISIAKLPYWDLHWYNIAKKAKSLANVFLSGDGGDELFGGYTFRYKKFLSLEKRHLTALDRVKSYLACHERDWVPDQEKIFGKKIVFSWNEIYSLLGPYFDNKLAPLSQVFLADYNGKLLYNMVPLYHKFHNFFKLTYVAPLLTDKLISYATHLPLGSKYDSEKNIGKILLLKILEKYNVGKLITEKKQGFSVNTVNLWNTDGHKLCKYYLDNAMIVKDGWIDKEWIKKYIEKTDLNVRYINKFLGLLAFEIWYRLFITKEISENELLEF